MFCEVSNSLTRNTEREQPLIVYVISYRRNTPTALIALGSNYVTRKIRFITIIIVYGQTNEFERFSALWFPPIIEIRTNSVRFSDPGYARAQRWALLSSNSIVRLNIFLYSNFYTRLVNLFIFELININNLTFSYGISTFRISVTISTYLSK